MMYDIFTQVPGPVILRNVRMLWISCQLVTRTQGTTLRHGSVDEHMVPPGLAVLRAATYGVDSRRLLIPQLPR